MENTKMKWHCKSCGIYFDGSPALTFKRPSGNDISPEKDITRLSPYKTSLQSKTRNRPHTKMLKNMECSQHTKRELY